VIIVNVLCGLSTHADRQGVDIIVCCLCVCTVRDFSAEDKASGVTFCSAVHRLPRQGITNFVNFAPQKPKIGRIGQRAGHDNPRVNITEKMRRRKRHARDVPFEYIARHVDVGSACDDIR